MWQGLIWLACSVLIVVGLNQLDEQQVQTPKPDKRKTDTNNLSSPSETHSSSTTTT